MSEPDRYTIDMDGCVFDGGKYITDEPSDLVNLLNSRPEPESPDADRRAVHVEDLRDGLVRITYDRGMSQDMFTHEGKHAEWLDEMKLLFPDTEQPTPPGCHSLCNPNLHVGGCPNKGTEQSDS